MLNHREGLSVTLVVNPIPIQMNVGFTNLMATKMKDWTRAALHAVNEQFCALSVGNDSNEYP